MCCGKWRRLACSNLTLTPPHLNVIVKIYHFATPKNSEICIYKYSTISIFNSKHLFIRYKFETGRSYRGQQVSINDLWVII